ncbi:MAG: hypothetical protein J5666_05885 [Bacilli bacterium]|nr:hypothetical protein [Bacilli bacterium]
MNLNETYFEKVDRSRKKVSFKIARFLVKLLYHKPKMIFLGEKFNDGPFLFLINHCGTKTPPKIECYFERDFYMWGTYEMTQGLKAVHHYLVHTFYHQKKKWPLFFAALVGTIFSPFAYMFYQGMRIIPTYHDSRFLSSIKNSLRVLNDNKVIVIYPEDSNDGYKDKIEKFFNGYLTLCDIAKRKGLDLPIYVAYYNRKKNKIIIDNPVYYSSLCNTYSNQDEISEVLRNKMNDLINI